MRAIIPGTTVLLAAVSGCFLLLSPARAEEESAKVRTARLESELEKEAQSTDAACGTKLAVKIEWAGFEGVDAWKDKSVSGYCEAPLGALRTLCDGAASKAHIQKTVKTFVCKAAKDKSGWKVVSKSGTVEWHVSPDSTNNDAYAKEQLLRNL